MSRFEEPHYPECKMNDAERELISLIEYRGRELATYESDSEWWNGTVVSGPGKSAEAARYEACEDEDAGFQMVMPSHMMFDVEPGESHASTIRDAKEWIDTQDCK